MNSQSLASHFLCNEAGVEITKSTPAMLAFFRFGFAY
jgi:hypothetical protein